MLDCLWSKYDQIQLDGWNPEAFRSESHPDWWNGKKRLELIDQWKADDDIYYAIINIEALRKDTIFDELDDVAEVIICDEIIKPKTDGLNRDMLWDVLKPV